MASLVSLIALIAFQAQHVVAEPYPQYISWMEGLSNETDTEYNVLSTDYLDFSFEDDSQDVWKLPNKEAYDLCDFTNAEEVKPGDYGVQYQLSAPGDYYFAQKADDGCARGIKINISATEGPRDEYDLFSDVTSETADSGADILDDSELQAETLPSDLLDEEGASNLGDESDSLTAELPDVEVQSQEERMPEQNVVDSADESIPTTETADIENQSNDLLLGQQNEVASGEEEASLDSETPGFLPISGAKPLSRPSSLLSTEEAVPSDVEAEVNDMESNDLLLGQQNEVVPGEEEASLDSETPGFLPISGAKPLSRPSSLLSTEEAVPSDVEMEVGAMESNELLLGQQNEVVPGEETNPVGAENPDTEMLASSVLSGEQSGVGAGEESITATSEIPDIQMLSDGQILNNQNALESTEGAALADTEIPEAEMPSDGLLLGQQSGVGAGEESITATSEIPEIQMLSDGQILNEENALESTDETSLIGTDFPETNIPSDGLPLDEQGLGESGEESVPTDVEFPEIEMLPGGQYLGEETLDESSAVFPTDAGIFSTDLPSDDLSGEQSLGAGEEAAPTGFQFPNIDELNSNQLLAEETSVESNAEPLSTDEDLFSTDMPSDDLLSGEQDLGLGEETAPTGFQFPSIDELNSDQLLAEETSVESTDLVLPTDEDLFSTDMPSDDLLSGEQNAAESEFANETPALIDSEVGAFPSETSLDGLIAVQPGEISPPLLPEETEQASLESTPLEGLVDLQPDDLSTPLSTDYSQQFEVPTQDASDVVGLESTSAESAETPSAFLPSISLGLTPTDEEFGAAAVTSTDDGVVIRETIPWGEPITMPNSGQTLTVNQYEAIVFDYQSGGPSTPNVVRVSTLKELEQCDMSKAITLNGPEGPYRLQFQTGGTYYITSSVGTQCQNGLKMTVRVTSATSNDPITLKGMVYYDRDNNVVRDQSEGLANVPITITKGDEQVASAMTDDQGEWLVTDLPAGTYEINIGQIPGLSVNDSPGMHKTVTVEGGGLSTFNFRIVGSGSTDGATIQGNIYYDKNANRQPDDGEGISNASVSLRSSSTGAVVGTEKTGTDGFYSFTVPDGYYKLVIETLPNYNVAGLPVVKDIVASPGNVIKFNYYVTPPPPGATGAIVGTIFSDNNGNNNFDAGEGIQGAKVSVLQMDTTVNVAQVTTDVNGAYHVEVKPGRYRVMIGPIPGYPMPSNTDTSKTITVGPQTENTYNFKVSGAAPSPFGSITGQVYRDANGNAVADPGEGNGGVMLTLTNKDTDQVVDTKNTDTNGSYGFDSIQPGSYEVRIVQIDGEDVSPDANSKELYIAENSKSNLDFQLESTTTALTGARISGTVFNDLDNNEVDDIGEGLSQIKVSVQDATNGEEVYQAYTDNSGKYNIDIEPGTYDVVIDSIPNVDIPLEERTRRVTVLAGTLVPFNFRIATPSLDTPGAVEGTLFKDLNNNNAADAGEGIGGVSVTAFTPTGETAGQSQSDSEGKFNIPLAAGDYRVELGEFPDVEVPLSYRTKELTVPAGSNVNFSFRVSGVDE